MWKGNGDTTTLLFSLKGLEILHQDRRGQVKTIVTKHNKSILFQKLTISIQINQSIKQTLIQVAVFPVLPHSNAVMAILHNLYILHSENRYSSVTEWRSLYREARL